mmetsp:Transcript_4221/g.10553  ORF Transcript_4221/g.10553 Transcript_4221/m.10553 type:complete len:329 (-) Transcript_4221:548-1534(-)
MAAEQHNGSLTVVHELKCRGPGLYTVEARMRFMTCAIPVRMTIVVLNKKPGPSSVSSPVSSPVKRGIFGGHKPARVEDLLLISPFAATDELVELVKTLGSVKFVLAPNTMHHLWAGEWRGAFPGSKLLAPASLAAKRPDLAIDVALPVTPGPCPAVPGLPADVVSLLPLPGLNDEVTVLHKPSRTLVVADAAFNFEQGGETQLPGAPMSWYLSLTGGYAKCSLTTPFKWLIKDAAAVGAALDAVLAAPWDALVMAHGSPVMAGGKAALAAGTRAFVAQLEAAQAAAKTEHSSHVYAYAAGGLAVSAVAAFAAARFLLSGPARSAPASS